MYRLQTESQWEHCDSLADNDSWRCSVLTEKTKRKLPGSLWCTVQPLTSPLLPPISATMKMRQNSHDQENYTLPLKERKKKKEKKILVTQNIHLQFSFNTNFSTLARHWRFNMQLLKTEQFWTITVCISAVRGGQYEKPIFWLVVGFFPPSLQCTYDCAILTTLWWRSLLHLYFAQFSVMTQPSFLTVF